MEYFHHAREDYFLYNFKYTLPALGGTILEPVHKNDNKYGTYNNPGNRPGNWCICLDGI